MAICDAMKVRWPNIEEMEDSARRLEENRENRSFLKNVFGMVDGWTLPCADYIDIDMKNAYYEGYTGNV